MIKSFLPLSLTVTVSLIICASSWCYYHQFTHTDDVYEASYSPDGSKVVLASKDGNNYIYNALTMQVQYPYVSQKARSAKYSPNGNYIAFGFNNNSVLILDSSYNFVADLSTSIGDVREVHFNANSDKLLVCGNNGNDGYEIWTVPGWSKVHSDYSYGDDAKSCRFANNGNYVVGSKDGRLRYYDSSYNLIWVNVRTPASEILGVDFSPNSSYILMTWATNNRGVSIFSVNSNVPITNLSISNSISVLSVDWSQDGTLFSFGDKQKNVYVYNGTKQQAFDSNLQLFSQMNSDVNSIDFSYDSQWLVAGIKDNNVFFYKRDCTPNPINNQQHCPAEYYRDSTDSCRFCASDMTGCRKCTNSSACLSCSDQYYLDAGTGLCLLCMDTLTACVQCETGLACQHCLSSHFLSAGSCLSCLGAMEGCLQCSSAAVCLECAANSHYLAANGTCVPCSDLPDPFCLHCNSSSCLLCSESHFIAANGTCQRCPYECSSCSNSSSCLTCSPSFYLSGADCLACIGPCLACSSPVLCESCLQGFYLSGTSCLQCVASCSVCSSSPTNCHACNVGFYLSGAACTSCGNDCLACTNATACIACDVGSFLNSSSSSCQNCASLDPSCHLCTQSECLECSSGSIWNGTACQLCSSAVDSCQVCQGSACVLCLTTHYLDGSACQPCLSPCLSCSSNTSCLSCSFGFFLNSSNSCAGCPCPSCTSPSACTSCQLGSYLSGGACLECSSIHAHCMSCNDSSTCLGCGPPFFPNAGTCQRCPQGCTACNSSSSCLSCDLGFFLNGATCDRCSPGCSECSTSSNCSQCLQGFYLDAPSASCLTCSSLSQGCLACDSSGCLACDFGNGFFLASSACQQCASALPNCRLCLNSTHCQACQSSFALDGSQQCAPCLSLIPGCQNCDSASSCSLCTFGFFPSGGSCPPCPHGCSFCSNGSACAKCLPQFFLDGSSLCTSCASSLPGCKSCSSPSACSSCSFGYYLGAGGTCSPCLTALSGCFECHNSSSCVACESGFHLDAASASCLLCNSTFSGCAFCRNASQCDVCLGGYYLNGNGCSLCSDPSCLTCNASSCLQCVSGSFLEASGACSNCSTLHSTCLFCNSSECLNCQTGHYLSSGSCQQCQDANCQVCNSTNSSQCLHCNIRFILTNGSCDPCSSSISSCIECSTASVCSSCLLGYYLQAGGWGCTLCSQAIPYCRQCSGSSICNVCNNGYYLSGSACLLCASTIEGCAFCQIPTICQNCLQGYYLNTTTQLCFRCAQMEGCIICRDNTSCQLCDEGYYLSNGTCQNCTMQGCIMCNSSSVCTRCEGSYTLSGTSCLIIILTYAYEEFSFISQYQSRNMLSHTLWINEGQFSYTSEDLTLTTNISYLAQGGNITQLTINNFKWGDKYRSIIFYTNNPFDFQSQTSGLKSMNLFNTKRRFLASSKFDPNVNFLINMDQNTVGIILPSVTHGGILELYYNINEPQFIASVLVLRSHYYHFFGWFIVLYIILFYIIKGVIIDREGKDKGQLIAHILFLKTPALMVFPSYSQLIDYCSGYMIADMPWFDSFFGNTLSDFRDASPQPFRLFYVSMSIASTYLLPLLTMASLFVIFGLIYCNFPECKVPFKNFASFVYCFFLGGISFAVAACVQGAFLNFSKQFTVSFSFYLLGIILGVILIGQAFWSCVKDMNNIYKFRIFTKAVTLSLLHYNPFPFSSLIIFFEAFFIFLELKLSNILFPKLWFSINLIVNLNLVFLIIFSSSLIMIYSSALLAIVTLVLEFIRLQKQRQYKSQISDLKIKNEYVEEGKQVEKDLVVKQPKSRDFGLEANFYTRDEFVLEQSRTIDVKTRYTVGDSQQFLFSITESFEKDN